MSSPYHFSPRAPVAPHPTPASASRYSLPKPRAPRPPILNPYDKFTQPEFDTWIGDITGALRQALGQEDSKPLPHTEKISVVSREETHSQAVCHTESDASDDEAVNDSFAEFKARRALGKGKARDPREGPGLWKGGSIQPIEIVSSDEEEEEEVKLAITSMDGDLFGEGEEVEEEGEEAGQEDQEEEAQDDERYPWEGDHGSAEILPSLRDSKTTVSSNSHEECYLDEEEYEDDEDEYYEDEVEYDEVDVECDEDEVEYEDQADNENRGQYTRASPEVIDILSDDEEIERPKLLESQASLPTYGYVDQFQDDDEVIDRNNEESYSEEEVIEENTSLRGPTSGGHLPSSSGYEQRIYDDEEEHDEIIDDSDDDGIQEIYAKGSSSLAKISSGVSDSNGVARNIFQLAQVHAQEHHPRDVLPSSGQVPANMLSSDNSSHSHEDSVSIHEEERDDPAQPWSQDTSFPPRNPHLLEQQSEVDLPDHWSGPRQYAQDYYSGGQIIFPEHGKPDLNHLAPGDVEPTVADSREEDFVDEIEDEIQPIDIDTAFPPHDQGPMLQSRDEISDPWAGPRMYAEDYYSGGDIRASPGEHLNPFVLRGTGDLDDSIDNFLTPSALSPNPSNAHSSANGDRETSSNHSERHAINQPTEFFHVSESDDESMTNQPPVVELSLQAEERKEQQTPEADARRISGENLVEEDILSSEIITGIHANDPIAMSDTPILNLEQDVDIFSQHSTPLITEAMSAVAMLNHPDALGKIDRNDPSAEETALLNPPLTTNLERSSLPSCDEVVPVEDITPAQVPPATSNQQVVDVSVVGEQFEVVTVLKKRADELYVDARGPVELLEGSLDGSNEDEAKDVEFADKATIPEGLPENVTVSEPDFNVPLEHQSSLTSVAEEESANLFFPEFNDNPTEEEIIEKTCFNGQLSSTGYTVIESADITEDLFHGPSDQVSDSISISSVAEPVEDKKVFGEGDPCIVEEAVTEDRLSEEPRDRGMSLDIASLSANELESEISRRSPIFIERKVSPGPSLPQVKETGIPQTISGDDKDAGLNPSEVAAPNLQDVFSGDEGLSSALGDALTEISTSHVGDSPSKPPTVPPTSKQDVLEVPDAAADLANSAASTKNARRSPTPQISGDARDFVLSSMNEAFFSSNLPSYFGDLLPHNEPAVQQDAAFKVAAATPFGEPHSGEVNGTTNETFLPLQARESHEALTSAVPMTQMVLTHNPTVPTNQFEAYPYNLSAPNPLLRLLSPSARLSAIAALNALASSSKYTSFSTLQNTPVSQVSLPPNPTSQVSVPQAEEINDRDVDELTDPNTTDDLELQYPPDTLQHPSAQSIVEEISVVGPTFSSSKTEENELTHKAETSAAAIVEKSSTIDTEAPLVTDSVSVQKIDIKTAVSDTSSSVPISVEELKVLTQKSETVASVKRSTKRKRDTALLSPDDTSKSAASQKPKGRRAPKSDRKGKSAQQTTEMPVVASEDTIHVRPRPKESTDVFGAPLPYRILQSSSRPSFTFPDSSDKHSAAQSSTTVNKSSPLSTQPTFPLTSLFHAHGKARKQQLLSNLPPKIIKQAQPLRSSSVSPTLKSPEPLPSSSGAPPENVITPLEIPTALVPLSTPTEAQPDVPPTPVTPLPTSPVSVTEVISSPITFNSVPAHAIAGPSAETVTAPIPTPSQPAMSNTPSHHSKPSRSGSITSSPITRSHCRYHRISLPKEEGGPRVTFLVPGCSLNDKELMKDEEIEDHGDATVEDSHRMIKDIESLNFHSDLIGVLRQLVGLDILREQEVFYLPPPGEDVPRKNSLMKSVLEKSAMVRVPADSSSYAGSPSYSAYSVSPGSFRATSASGSMSPSIGGLRSFLDSEKSSSFAPTDTEHSDGEAHDNKRNKLGPPTQSKGKEKRRSHMSKTKADAEGSETGRSKKARKSSSKRGVKRSRTEGINDITEGQPNSKKLRAHLTEPGLSPEKHNI